MQIWYFTGSEVISIITLYFHASEKLLQHLLLCRINISAITDLSVVQISRYAFQLLTAAGRVHQEESG